MGRLTATAVKAAKEAGRYNDGEGLALLIGKRGGKSWMVRIQKDGRRRDIGLGSASKVPLKLARERAAAVRSQVEAGIDPIAERQKAAGIPTFAEAAKMVFAENEPNWRNPIHRAQWLSSLERYAFPAFGNRSVVQVDAAAVRDALAVIWLAKPETAKRVRQRTRAVIDWAVAKGYRETGLAMPVIDRSLPKQRAKPKHHPALPYAELPEFMGKLRSGESMGRLALEAVILTAGRSGEIRGAVWSELDLEAALWTIPADRMKGGREHVVPLSEAAVDLFTRMKEHKRGDSHLVFPGQKRGRPLSDMTLTKVMRDMELKATPHGFRSTFRDWVAEQTDWPAELAEAALAHVVRDKTVAAYQLGSMLEKRRELMAAWADYCDGLDGLRILRLVV